MKKFISIVFFLAAIVSCSTDDSQLDRTIFIPDEHDENLPAYTEWGYNSFGARYERTYFLASRSIIPCKIMYANDSLHFLMDGICVNIYPLSSMSLTMIFPSERIANYDDLLVLHKKVVDLSNDCTVKLTSNGNEKIIAVTRGELNFKRVQLLKVDDVDNRIILSGTFELQFSGTSSFPESFADGRFDFGITSREFYTF